ncbi:hypothetical protein KJ866_03735 [Patescibacteria group bacterium]|nr:hypothetical protein [Patescibacteria group bacterium]
MENFTQVFDPVAIAYQDAEKITKELETGSRYKREQAGSDKEIITSPESERFSVDRVRDAESPEVKKIYKFMKKFNPEEADTLDIIQDAVKVDDYAYHIAQDKKGKVVAHTQSSYLKMAPHELGEKATESILFIGYSITDDDFQRKGLASELFQSALKTGAEKAKAEQQALKGIVGEAVATSERFWNHVGLKRIYFEDKDGNFKEVPYICPPIQWDEKTGQPVDPETEEIGDKDIKDYSAPEHLMIRLINSKDEMSIQDLMPMIQTIYRDNYTLYKNPGEEYPTDEAIKYTQAAVNEFQKELEDILNEAKDAKLFLLSAKEREDKIAELKNQGKEFHELQIENSGEPESEKD